MSEGGGDDAADPTADDEHADEVAWEASTDETAAEDDVADPEEELPLSALRERVEAQRESEADSFAEVGDEEPQTDVDSAELFEEVEVGEVDGEAVWDAIVEGDADADELLGEEPRVESETEPTAEPTESPDEHVVEKREYCQRCEFFAAPPDATCTNDGTEIVELVDNDHFRVRGCPKVAADDEALSGFASDEE
jgi:hypothetical protein